MILTMFALSIGAQRSTSSVTTGLPYATAATPPITTNSTPAPVRRRKISMVSATSRPPGVLNDRDKTSESVILFQSLPGRQRQTVCELFKVNSPSNVGRDGLQGLKDDWVDRWRVVLVHPCSLGFWVSAGFN